MNQRNYFRTICIILGALLFTLTCLSALLGILLAQTLNIKNVEQFTEIKTALPTRLLDINGEIITEFASDEKREIITLEELPRHMIDALITREDQSFYKHRGFSIKAILRALYGQLTGRPLGGGSTLTQQIAGTLYVNRSDMTILRKIKELWWAIQMERRYSKNEILELYLNKIFFGGGTYGVSAASKYYFGHSASEITPAEAAVLVIQLSNPAFYNPFNYPNRARDRQEDVLKQMVALNFLSKEEADTSFNDFWASFDYTRINTSAYFMREDKAPWFSEYVLRQLSSIIYGTLDIYTGGFVVNTTLNLKHQSVADAVMMKQIEYANRTYQRSSGSRRFASSKVYIPISELLALTFDLPQIKVSQERAELRTLSAYNKTINPILDIVSLITGTEILKTDIVSIANEKVRRDAGKTTIEGTMISLETDTGYITSIVGGSKFDADNQFIRATQARIQPGSTFKPLYYSAGIDTRIFTAATQIDDAPTIFYNEAGVPYIPQNFKGEWFGTVQFWYALAKSMNVPSLKVLDGIGFDVAINRSVELLGIPQNEVKNRKFERVYPLGLGTSDVRPIEIARAFAIFGNQGREVEPIAVRSVQDRLGNTILDPERDLRIEQRRKGSNIQVISEQTAYIMTDILKNSVTMGTLASPTQWGAAFRYKDAQGNSYTVPAAGKTGTTQNWTNAWAVGYTPNLTAVVWFGFDQPGQSLGVELTGSTLAGATWAEFMKVANEDYPIRDFVRPQSGLVYASVCSVSGFMLTPACGKSITRQFFLDGTQPTRTCDFHINRKEALQIGIQRIAADKILSGVTEQVDSSSAELQLDLSFLEDYIKESAETIDEQLPPEEESFNFLFE
ncbi:MAG: penicillin-binding protein 1A [Treponemataceae bacterium]